MIVSIHVIRRAMKYAMYSSVTVSS